MNCRHFQNNLHEYIDGTLPLATATAAVQHLGQCKECRDALQHEQQLAQALSGRLRQQTAHLALSPETRDRILTSLNRQPTSPTASRSTPGYWHRIAVPMGMAASLILITSLLLTHRSSRPPAQETKASRPAFHSIPTPATIEISYRVPRYTYRREGDRVVDQISYDTVVATGTLWSGGDNSSNHETQIP